MVALNVQTWGRAMSLAQAKFDDNGGCGYVLKPAWLRGGDRGSSDDDDAHHDRDEDDLRASHRLRTVLRIRPIVAWLPVGVGSMASAGSSDAGMGLGESKVSAPLPSAMTGIALPGTVVSAASATVPRASRRLSPSSATASSSSLSSSPSYSSSLNSSIHLEAQVVGADPASLEYRKIKRNTGTAVFYGDTGGGARGGSRSRSPSPPPSAIARPSTPALSALPLLNTVEAVPLQRSADEHGETVLSEAMKEEGSVVGGGAGGDVIAAADGVALVSFDETVALGVSAGPEAAAPRDGRARAYAAWQWKGHKDADEMEFLVHDRESRAGMELLYIEVISSTRGGRRRGLVAEFSIALANISPGLRLAPLRSHLDGGLLEGNACLLLDLSFCKVDANGARAAGAAAGHVGGGGRRGRPSVEGMPASAAGKSGIGCL